MFDGASLWYKVMGCTFIAVILSYFIFDSILVPIALAVVALVVGRLLLGFYNDLEQRDIDDVWRQSKKKKGRR